jgi:signal transduction histidine kinase
VRLSLRIEQTVAFVTVVLVAMVILSVWMMGDLRTSVHELARAEQVKDAGAVAIGLSPFFGNPVANGKRIRDQVARYVEVLGDDVLVFDAAGRLIAGDRSLEIPPSFVREAAARGLADPAGYSRTSFEEPTYVMAAKGIDDPEGVKAGVVVVANSGLAAQTTLVTASSQLTVAVVVTLLIAALIGFAFSEIIARQTRRLVEAANAVAEGDFSRRLPRGLLPDEIRELVDAFNRMAAQLGEAFDTLKGQDEAQRQFVASASHELRTPVAALKGAIEILEDGADEKPATRARFLGTMRVEVERLQRLVDHLFTLAQVDAGRLVLHERAENLSDVIDVVVTSMGPLAEEAGVTIRSQTAEPGPIARFDRDRITQVLVALVDNAIKHSGPGDVVTVSAGARADRVEVTVSDTGTGIAPEAMPRIYERFYTDRAAESGGRRGSGLGLSIAKEVIEAHGSAITAESTLGVGTTFRFTLPLAPVQKGRGAHTQP